MTTPTFENSVINLWCLADVLRPRGLVCGCPECLAKDGLTAMYQVEHFVPKVYPLGWWPKLVCTEKLARLCPERICQGWPGSVEPGR